MEATVKLAGDERIVKVSGDTPKDLFSEMAMAYEVFGETNCGLCHSTNIRPKHRQVEKYHYYEYECQDCRAKLQMGQLQDNSGGLFPVRKLMPNGKPHFRDGDYGEHEGWTRYRGDGDQQQQAPQQFAEPPQTRLAALLRQAGAKDGKDAVALVDFCSAGTVAFQDTRNDDELCERAIKQVHANMKQWGQELMSKAREN